MKNLKLFVIALLIGTTGVFASEISTEPLKKSDIATQIENLLEQTEFTFNNTSQVQITFTFNSEGEIVVLKVNSADKAVLNYIRKNLNGKTIENPGERDKLYCLNLKLQVI
jgi:hypothetical protein